VDWIYEKKKKLEKENERKIQTEKVSFGYGREKEK
jgi:hypothetical protein